MSVPCAVERENADAWTLREEQAIMCTYGSPAGDGLRSDALRSAGRSWSFPARSHHGGGGGSGAVNLLPRMRVDGSRALMPRFGGLLYHHVLLTGVASLL